MKYLLDVNVLLALGFYQHEFHERVASWVRGITSAGAELATCPITELGFVRVLAQTVPYGFDVLQARQLLLKLKSAGVARFVFIGDDQDISNLPGWVKAPGQTTDGHLSQLATSKGAMLATLDRKIPRSFFIPR